MPRKGETARISKPRPLGYGDLPIVNRVTVAPRLASAAHSSTTERVRPPAATSRLGTTWITRIGQRTRLSTLFNAPSGLFRISSIAARHALRSPSA